MKLPISIFSASANPSSILTIGILNIALSQSWVQTRFCMDHVAKELLNGSRTHPPVVNIDSESTVEIGIAKTS